MSSLEGEPRPTLRPLSEAEFQRQVTDLATIYGWEHVHFRPAQTSKGWRTPVSGTLGKGWPDLVLVRERDRRLLFVELKRDGKKPDPEQERTLDVLRSLECPYLCGGSGQFGGAEPTVSVAVWRPSDFESIAAVLR